MQAAVPGEDDEIDWTHFTFQHGFRQLPQHLPHQLPQRLPSAPSLATNGPASTDAEMSEAGHSPSPADLPTQRFDAKTESDIKPASEIKVEPGIKKESGAALDSPSTGQAAFKQEAPQHAQHGPAAEASADRQAGVKEEEDGAEQGTVISLHDNCTRHQEQPLILIVPTQSTIALKLQWLIANCIVPRGKLCLNTLY